MALKVTTLGEHGVFLDGRAIVWPSVTTRDLFFLLLGYPAGQTREQIIDALWESASTPASRSNFKVTLYRLKRTLGDPDAVTEEQHTYALHPRYAAASDDTHFRAALALMHRADQRADRLRYGYRAAMLYGGDYLQAYGQLWAEERRDLLRREYVQLRLTLAGLHCEAVECSTAIRNLSVGLASDPLCGEQYHQTLMTCLHTMGRTSDALTHFRHYTLFVQRELGDTLSDESVRLADDLKSGRAHAATQIGGSLPCPRRSLYGLMPRATGKGVPLDLSAWAAELRRGQALHALATRLTGSRSWQALARHVRTFLEGPGGITHAALLEGHWRPIPAQEPLVELDAWPAEARLALHMALTMAFQTVSMSVPEGLLINERGWSVQVVPLADAAGMVRATLCLGVPEVPGPGPLDAELPAQVAALLRHLLMQPSGADRYPVETAQ